MLEFFSYVGYGVSDYVGYVADAYGELIFLVLLIALAIFSAVSSAGVKTMYNKYRTVDTASGMTGAQAARAILDKHGLYNVGIAQIEGEITDNFNPKTNVVSLSSDVYNSTSVSALGIASHEVGHALQFNGDYFPIKIRQTIVPVMNVSSRFSWLLIFIGVTLMAAESVSNDIGYFIALAGVLLFAVSTLFYLVTYPIELNASRRGIQQLKEVAVLSDSDIRGIKKVQKAAGRTYLSALLTSLLYLLRYASLVRGRRR